MRIATLYKIPGMLYRSITGLILRFLSGRSTGLAWIFCRDERGAFAVIFAILFPMLLGLIAWQIDGTRYLYEKARLSDVLEQATLALTVENNDNANDNKTRNKEQVREWVGAYMPAAVITTKDNSITVDRIVEYPPGKFKPTATWRAYATTKHASWFSSHYFPSFFPEVAIGGNGGAQKNLPISLESEEVAVVFVIDFSSSMNGYLGNQATADPSQPKQTKNQELKRILRKLTQKVYQNSRSQVGFVPFAIGVATQLSDGSRFCTIPWHSNIPITDLSRIPALFAPSPTYNYRDVKDYKRLSELIALNVNIDATLDGILDPIAAENTVSIPMKQVGFYFCDHHDWPEENQPVPLPPPAQQQIIPLTTDIRELKKIEYMKPLGSTFTTAGILAGVKLLHQSPVRKKRLIIISDGDDVEYLHITKQLIAKGMCEKIKRQGKIEMAFIGIEYLPPTNQNDSSVNWRDACVGADHFYTPDTVQSLEDALTHAVLPGTKEEMGRNVPKRH